MAGSVGMLSGRLADAWCFKAGAEMREELPRRQWVANNAPGLV
jgi:hypothetical protein